MEIRVLLEKMQVEWNVEQSGLLYEELKAFPPEDVLREYIQLLEVTKPKDPNVCHNEDDDFSDEYYDDLLFYRVFRLFSLERQIELIENSLKGTNIPFKKWKRFDVELLNQPRLIANLDSCQSDTIRRLIELLDGGWGDYLEADPSPEDRINTLKTLILAVKLVKSHAQKRRRMEIEQLLAKLFNAKTKNSKINEIESQLMLISDKQLLPAFIDYCEKKKICFCLKFITVFIAFSFETKLMLINNYLIIKMKGISDGGTIFEKNMSVLASNEYLFAWFAAGTTDPELQNLFEILDYGWKSYLKNSPDEINKISRLWRLIHFLKVYQLQIYGPNAPR